MKYHVEIARKLRKNMTEAEALLWEELRNRRLEGFKFNRQFPFVYREIEGKKDFFVLDFYCAQKKIAIELDGGIHLTQQDYDRERDRIISESGIKVLRFKNEETADMQNLLKKILEELLA